MVSLALSHKNFSYVYIYNTLQRKYTPKKDMWSGWQYCSRTIAKYKLIQVNQNVSEIYWNGNLLSFKLRSAYAERCITILKLLNVCYVLLLYINFCKCCKKLTLLHASYFFLKTRVTYSLCIPCVLQRLH